MLLPAYPTWSARRSTGLLCVYQAVRALMNAGAEYASLDPDRISFSRAKEAAARHLSDVAPSP